MTHSISIIPLQCLVVSFIDYWAEPQEARLTALHVKAKNQTPDQLQLIVSCSPDGGQFGELSAEFSISVGHCWVSYGKFLRLQRHVTLSCSRRLRISISILNFGSFQFSFELSEKQVGFPLGPPHGAGKQFVVVTQTHTHQPLLVGSPLWSISEWALILPLK